MTSNHNDALRGTLADIAGRHTGQLGVAARNLTTGEELLLSADEVFPTASVIKLPILVELMRQATGGRVSLDDRVELLSGDRRGGSGILKAFDAGLRPTLRDVATLMIVLSDNTATNLVIDSVGDVGAVNAAMDELGLSSIRLHNRVDFEVIGDDVHRLDESSPRDMRTLVQGFAKRAIFAPQICEVVENVLAAQQYLDQVPRYLRVSPYAAELGMNSPVTVANKTGFFPGTRADAGIVRFHGVPSWVPGQDLPARVGGLGARRPDRQGHHRAVVAQGPGGGTHRLHALRPALTGRSQSTTRNGR